jgi:hypothetical protein
VAFLVLRRASRQFVRCTTGQVQINVFLISSKACRPTMPFGLCSTYRGCRTSRSTVQRACSYIRLWARHLSTRRYHGFCIFTVFPSPCSVLRPRGHDGTYLRRRSDVVLDQPLVDKIHTPSVITVDHGFSGHRHCSGLRNTHSSRMYTFLKVNAEPSNCWLLLVRTSNLYQPLLTQRYSRDQCQAYSL